MSLLQESQESSGRCGYILGNENASEITAESAENITTIIQQQAIASEQILITLKQISAGVQNFTMATDYISESSEKLKVIATELSDSTKSSDDEDETEENEEVVSDASDNLAASPEEE